MMNRLGFLLAIFLCCAAPGAQAASIEITSPAGGEVGGMVHISFNAQFAAGETSTGFAVTVVGADCNARRELMALSGYPGDSNNNLTLCWNTLSVPESMDHWHEYFPNGLYTIEAYYEWVRADDPNPANPTIYTGSATTTVTLRNLTVTPVTPEKILASNTPGSFPISYTLQDAVQQETLVTVEVRNSSYNVVWSREFMQAPGSYTVTWDGWLEPGIVAPAGVYLARVYGSHTNACTGPAYDHPWQGSQQVNRSALDDDQNNSHLSLSIGVSYADVGAGRLASMATDYSIADTWNRTPSQATVEVYRPTTIALAQSVTVSRLLGPHQVFISQALSTALDWTFLLDVLDNDYVRDKDHRNRRRYLGALHHVPPCATFGFVYSPEPDGSPGLDTTGRAIYSYDQLGLVQPGLDAPPDTRSLYSGEHPLGIEGGYIQDATVARGQEEFLENAIWHFNGHGPFDAANVQWNYMVFADGGLLSRDFLLDKDLSHLRLAVFLGCSQAANDANGGNFVDTVIDRGGKSAVGFTDLTYTTENVYWNERFWYYCTKEGLAITAAATNAMEETAARFNYDPADVTHVKSMSVNSQGTVLLHRAGWG